MQISTGHSFFALLGLAGLLALPVAQGEELDWDLPTSTWDPAGPSNLSETFDGIAGGSITVTVSDVTGTDCGTTPAGDRIPCTQFLSPAPPSPAVNQNNTGGLVPPENSLYIATDYPMGSTGSGVGPGDPTAPAVRITFDFGGFDNGVGNIEFTLYDLDASVSFHDDVTVTAMALDGSVIDPSQIISGSDNQVVSANGVSGVPGSGSPSNSSDGNVTFRFSQNGVARVAIVYRNIINQPDPGFQSISISDLTFVPSLPMLEPPVGAFDNTTIVGKVFNDLNGDGWQDPGEDGVPGVRLATTEGLVIETDAHGRYHIAAVDGGFRDRGRNFIVKVDTATLPRGTSFTTENPRQQRITRGTLNRFDFGVQLPDAGPCCEEVELKLGELFFEPGSAMLRPEYTRVLRQFAGLLREHGGGVVTIGGSTAPGEVGSPPAAAPMTASYTLESRFDRLDATLKPDKHIPELDRIAAEWRGVENIRLQVAGHTSNVRIAPENRDKFRDNYALSRARATSVADYLRGVMDPAPVAVTVEGRGPDQPVASNATLAGRAANRRVELRITGQVPGVATMMSERAKKLAEDRALRVYLALEDMLGPEAWRSLDFRFDNDLPPEPLGKQCGLEDCAAEAGYAFELLPGYRRKQMPDDTRFARADDRRADLRGLFTIALPEGGVLSATEDPTVVEPRLAALGPQTLPYVNGRIGASSVFHVYMNYPAFLAKAELLVYRADDTDRVRPLARLAVPRTNYSRVEWDGYTGRESLHGDEELYFIVQVCDGDGRIDETAPQPIRIVSERRYVPAAATRLVPVRVAKEGVAQTGPSLRNSTPLDGKVLVFGSPGPVQRELQEYTLRTPFGSRKVELTPGARAQLDQIAAQMHEASDIRVTVIGHTDDRPIAPQNRWEFADNQVLSEVRARVVAQYLARALGLGTEQITAVGRGASQPLAEGKSEEARASNRRVEVRISGNRVRVSHGIVLVDPDTGATEPVTQTIEEAMNVLSAKSAIDANAAETVTPRRRSATRVLPVAQASAEALAQLYGRNDLELQTIPIRGSRVRVRGRDIAGGYGLEIDGQAIPLDGNGEFAAEYLMPLGTHNFDVRITDAAGKVVHRDELPLEITGEHMFAVAMVDLTLANNDVSGLVDPIPAGSRFEDDFLAEGRVAFYLKGRIKGKYLLTAQLDTQEEQLDDLIGNIDKKDPRAIFRRIDPDLYYPVYGDDSTTISDTDSQGRLYVRLEWDRSEARWGNFHTDITGNEFAQYNRSLYGGQVHYRSLDTTGLGEPRIEGQVFASETQTALGHVEFVGTAGSLYYLKHTDVLQGSEKARVELRDRDSGRVIANHTLVREVDYEIDELQGRIILARPLPSIANLIAPGLIRDTPLDGNDIVLIVDYEYVPDGFDTNKLTSGARGKYWVTDKLALGGTWVDEARPDEDYSLLGGDLTLKLGRGTYLKAEYAGSEATQTGRFRSADGGLSFSPLLDPGRGRSGDAYGIEGRLNSAEVLGTEREWIASGWWRRTDDNFSVARRDPGDDIVEFGAEVTGDVTDRLSLAARFATIEREKTTENEVTRLALQADYRLGRHGKLSGELRTEERSFDRGARQADATLGAIRYGHRIAPDIEVYGIGQVTIDKDQAVTENDLLTIGATAQVLGNAQLQGEFSTGDRGESARLGFDYALDSVRRVYGAYTHSTDRSDPFGGNQVVVGQRSRMSNQTELFTESQFTKRDDQAGLAHVLGLDFRPRPGWNFGLTLQTGEVATDIALIDRNALSVSAGYQGLKLNVASRIEYREDKGGSDLRQWLASNRIDFKVSEDLRLLAKLNLSDTSARASDADGANFVEGTVGAAFRPAFSDKLNVLSKYTYLSDLRGPQQIVTSTDQRSHIVTSDVVYRLNRVLDLGGKFGWRRSDQRAQRNAGDWLESTSLFGAVRGTYHLTHKWDGIIEVRALDIDTESRTRRGILIELDRHFGEHLKLGLGYNFTEFSDDLTETGFDSRGFFLNATGKY